MAGNKRKSRKEREFDARLEEVIRQWKEQFQNDCGTPPVGSIKAGVMEKLSESKTPYDARPIDEASDFPGLVEPKKKKKR